MPVEIRQLKDKLTGQEFVPVTAWEAIGNKPDFPDCELSVDYSFQLEGKFIFTEGDYDEQTKTITPLHAEYDEQTETITL